MMNKPKPAQRLSLSTPFRSPVAESTKINILTPGSLQRTSQKRKPTSPLSNQRSLSTNSLGTIFYNRIDTRTYTDVTSSGLASRVAKYGQGNSTTEPTEEKYKSLRTSFAKRSPFPLLSRKPELKNPPLRSNSLSSVRIAPPEKLTFYPASRSNILRSGSMVVQPTQSKRDDEPLAPPSDVGSIPAPSALDQLKETTRKRINNEELDAERIKKQCKEVTDIDGPSPNVVVAYKPPQMLKRGREIYGSTQSISPPEVDVQKKRLRTKYNEITGSLSSSLSLQTPQRKPVEVPIPHRLDLNAKSPPTIENSVPAEKVEPEKVVEKEFPQPSVPTLVATSVIKKVQNEPPPITLFNKKFDSTRPVILREDDDDNSEKIRFVKPKKDIAFTTDPLRKVEPNRLKLLLSCLSGALEDDSETVDTTDTSSQKIAEPVKQSENSSVEQPIPTTQPPSISFGTGTNTAITTNSAISTTSSAPTSIQSKPLITSASSAFAIVSNTSSIATTTNGASTLSEPVKATGFTFGAMTTTSSSAPLTASKPVETISPSTKADTFVVSSASAISTNTSTNIAVESVKPTFSFGNITTTTSVPSTTNVTNTTFNFGGGDSKALPSPIKPISSLPNNAAGGDTAINTAATTAATGFNFSAPASSAPSLFATSSTLTTIPSGNVTFGSSVAANETIPMANNTSLGILNDSTLNNTTFSSVAASVKPFGSGFATNTVTTTGGANVNKLPSFTSTSNTTNNTTTASGGPIFCLGTNPPAFGNQSSGGFNFKSPTSAAGFSFNATSPTSTATPAPVTNSTSKGSVFSRLGTVATSTTTPSKDLFTFSSNTTQANSTATVTPAKDLMFFSPAPQTNNKAQTNMFASSTSVFNNPSTTQNNIFGGANVAKEVPSFGSNAGSTFGNAQSNPPAFSSPSGNGPFTNANATTENNSVFGGNANNNATSGSKSSFGQASSPAPAFNFNSNSGANQQIFGGNNAIAQTRPPPPPAYGSNQQQNMFGQNGNNNPTSPFSGNNSGNSTQNSPFAFGGNNQQEPKSFSFGGGNANNNNSGSTGFNFASGQQQQQNNEPPKYSFPSASSPPPPPAYGGFGSQNNNNGNFGTPPGQSFNFSGNATPVFGTGSTGSSSGSPAFNFNTGSGLTPVTPAPLVPTFSIGTGGSQNQSAQRRPMRSAIRRLNK